MISPKEFYTVMTAVVPLYVAMLLAYGSVRWWKLLSPAQCSGINRFVAIFAVPLLSFQIISHNDPYQMNVRFIAADVLQKLIVLIVLFSWSKFKSRGGYSSSNNSNLDWTITLFMVSTLPNTLVLGIPLEIAMYGAKPASLVVQAVVLQCIVWYTLLLFLFEYRSAKNLILQQFPGSQAANIVSFRIDPDVMSLDGHSNNKPVETKAQVGTDGKIHVQVKLSPPPTPQKDVHSSISMLQSPGLVSPISSSRVGTPRDLDLTGMEIYSLQSSRNTTPLTEGRSSKNHTLQSNRHDFCLMVSSAAKSQNILRVDTGYSLSTDSSIVHTPKEAATPEDVNHPMFRDSILINNYTPSPRSTPHLQENSSSSIGVLISPMKLDEKKLDSYDANDMQMLVWSSSNSPVSDQKFGGVTCDSKYCFDSRRIPSTTDHTTIEVTPALASTEADYNFVDNILFRKDANQTPMSEKIQDNLSAVISSCPPLPSTSRKLLLDEGNTCTEMPPSSVMSKLILSMMWRKLIRNPNTYASLLGLAWALVAYRWNIGMPKIVEHSITILSDAGLGMAMFSLGLFMALQTRILACGTTMAIVVMIIRFITGPSIMSATSIAVGLRNLDLRASIVQAALPQGIVPFVFAKEYNVHPDVLSTAVIFGMLVSLPITLLYYVLLGL